MRLEHLRGKSREAVEKEFLIAVVGYGLVRAFMAQAAQRAGIHPRKLSFTRAYGLINGWIGRLCSTDREEAQPEFDRLLDYIAQAKLPNRSKPRSYPRAVWGSGKYYPGNRSLPAETPK